MPAIFEQIHKLVLRTGNLGFLCIAEKAEKILLQGLYISE
jgi:hypothetical protein